MIHPADKGGCLVIFNKSDYEEEMERHLNVEGTKITQQSKKSIPK